MLDFPWQRPLPGKLSTLISNIIVFFTLSDAAIAKSCTQCELHHKSCIFMKHFFSRMGDRQNRLKIMSHLYYYFPNTQTKNKHSWGRLCPLIQNIIKIYSSPQRGEGVRNGKSDNFARMRVQNYMYGENFNFSSLLGAPEEGVTHNSQHNFRLENNPNNMYIYSILIWELISLVSGIKLKFIPLLGRFV